jgi:hypothetical protein
MLRPIEIGIQVCFIDENVVALVWPQMLVKRHRSGPNEICVG